MNGDICCCQSDGGLSALHLWGYSLVLPVSRFNLLRFQFAMIPIRFRPAAESWFLIMHTSSVHILTPDLL